jgi:hypothetical protein
MSGKKFSHDEYQGVVSDTVDEINRLGKLKGGEYAGDYDRLANFRRNGQTLGLPMEVVWAIYAAKHWDAVQQFVQDLNTGTKRERAEPIEGRIDDLIVYLILFKCIIKEHQRDNE